MPKAAFLVSFWILDISLWILITLLFRSTALADDRTLTIDEMVKAALDYSPTVMEIESRYAARLAESLEARLPQNPEFEAAIGFPSSWQEKRGKNEVEISISQPVRLSHGPLRNRVARLITEVGSYEKRKELLDLVVSTRLAFARAWVLNERRQVLSEVGPRSRSLSVFVAKGVASGAYSKVDESVLRSAAAQIESELKGVSAELLLANGELSRFVGQEIEGSTLLVPPLDPLVSTDTLETRLGKGETRLQERLQLLRELSEADAAVATRDAFPEFRPRLSYGTTNEGTELFGLGLTFDLPLYSQNSSERLRKEAEVRSATAKLRFSRSDVFQRSILDAARAFALRREEVLIYHDDVLPGLKFALEGMETQVRAGRGSILDLWQTSREYIDAQREYLERWTRAFAERTELGIMLEEEN